MSGSRPPHICFVTDYIYPVLSGDFRAPVIGGSEFQMNVLARAFVEAGHRVTVLTQDFGQADDIEIDGIRVLRTYKQEDGIPMVRFFFPRVASIIRAIDTADADIYYQQNASHLTGITAWRCRVRNKKSVYAGASDTDFMLGEERVRLFRDRWLFRWGLRHVDAIVSQSERQAALIRRNYDRTSVVIPNPYAVPCRQRPQSTNLVLWVGGIRHVKRPDRFVEIAGSMPETRFRMVGGPTGRDAASMEYFETIRSQASRVPNLEFMGFLPLGEVEKHFDEARVFVNTSEHEGFPNTFLQAWGRGIPTVSFFDAGARADGSRPFRLVASEADAESAIRTLLADRQAWDALSADCKEQFERKHSTASVIGEFQRLFSGMGWQADPARLRSQG